MADLPGSWGQAPCCSACCLLACERICLRKRGATVRMARDAARRLGRWIMTSALGDHEATQDGDCLAINPQVTHPAGAGSKMTVTQQYADEAAETRIHNIVSSSRRSSFMMSFLVTQVIRPGVTARVGAHRIKGCASGRRQG